MQKFGFVFPGQGSQKVGMLAELLAEQAVVGDTFAEASEVLELDLREIVQHNSDGLLDQTHITQPALLTASVALWRLWRQQGAPLPELLAGHSLGEYSALVCAGVLSFTDALAMVHRRGQYMQEAVPMGAGAMAAIIGMEDSQIGEICRKVAQDSVVAPANFNAPGQTVIAGEAQAVERAMAACKAAGAKRALPLNVSVPSHCELMKPAAERLAGVLSETPFNAPDIPVVQNINGRISKSPDEIRENLLKQLFMPVQWVDSILCMRDFGIGRIVECGPGKVLSGLVRRIEPQIECNNIEDGSSLEQARAAVSA